MIIFWKSPEYKIDRWRGDSRGNVFALVVKYQALHAFEKVKHTGLNTISFRLQGTCLKPDFRQIA